MRQGGHCVLRAFALTLLGSLATSGSPAAASAPLAAARLDGTFQLAGHVTVAVDIRGEHAGQRVKRSWTFTPRCPVGACNTIKLVRSRTNGKDTLVLHRQAPASYVGTGSFYAPLRCAGHIYRRGESVPFKVVVRITAAAANTHGVVVATRIKASYTNRSRTNLTACVAVPGHDAATYSGSLAQSPSSGGVSGQSPAGS